MRKSAIVVACLFFAALCYTGCRKTDENAVSTKVPAGDSIGPELEALFDGMPVATDDQVTPDKIVFADGTTIKSFADQYFPGLFAQHKGAHNDKTDFATQLLKVAEDKGPEFVKKALIMKMLERANELTATFPTPLANGQTKYAYVFGGDDETKLQAGAESICPEKLYGMDCSGFLFQVFKNAGILLPAHPASLQATSPTIKSALEKRYGTKVAKITVTEMEMVASAENCNKIQSGDIVAYYVGNTIKHIGIAYRPDPKTLILYQSDGKPSNSCEINKSAEKGPVRLIDDGKSLYNYWLKQKMRIVRFTIDISGLWDLNGRCVGATEDRLFLSLNFSKTTPENKHFTATGEGIDYDGSTHFTATIDGNYDPFVGELTDCHIDFDFPDHIRRDELPTVPLSGKDETGYFDVQCIANCGCDLQIKLKNKTK